MGFLTILPMKTIPIAIIKTAKLEKGVLAQFSHEFVGNSHANMPNTCVKDGKKHAFI
jgi:hypothetical protein